MIDFEYKDYHVFDIYEKQCNLYDLFGDDEELKNYKVINHMLGSMRLEAMIRRVAVIFFVYMEDGSVELYNTTSVKYPKMHEVLTDCYGFGQDAFCLFVDVNEEILNTKDFMETWFGVHFHRGQGYMELFDRDSALMEFSRRIPSVLRRLNRPLKGNGEFIGE